jgi:hypothetical protein
LRGIKQNKAFAEYQRPKFKDNGNMPYTKQFICFFKTQLTAYGLGFTVSWKNLKLKMPDKLSIQMHFAYKNLPPRLEMASPGLKYAMLACEKIKVLVLGGNQPA